MQTVKKTLKMEKGEEKEEGKKAKLRKKGEMARCV